jgi:hypothetical protein
MRKTGIIVTATAAMLLAGIGAAALAGPRAPEPRTIEGKNHPILLGRMVVTATALPDR